LREPTRNRQTSSSKEVEYAKILYIMYDLLSSMDVFLCPSCRFVLREPVTVSCGHSFCKRCLGEPLPSRCLVCRGKLRLLGSRAVRCNVLLGGLLEKCLAREPRLARLQSHAQELLRSRDYRAALRAAQKGLELGKRVNPMQGDGFPSTDTEIVEWLGR
uniref:RING-type domain-containing protein n=1 Tax=Gopherus agassizii TaxID=38772 RepID=A0A452HS16_9SAUR